jgi:hypothetical protein
MFGDIRLKHIPAQNRFFDAIILFTRETLVYSGRVQCEACLIMLR